MNVWIEENTMGSIGDAIRAKTGGTEKILPADMPNEIASIVTNPPLQEKSVTSNGEVTADEGYYGLSKVTVNVPTSGGGGGSGSGGSTIGGNFENGYTVNFYNTDNVLVESHSALFDFWIDAPISYTPSGWRNADGHINQFPLTVTAEEVNSTGIYNLYAVNETVADEVYAYYGVDKTVYPYLVIVAYNVSNNSIFGRYVDIWFTDELPTSTDVTGNVYYCKNIGESYNKWYTDIADFNEVFALMKSHRDTTTLTAVGANEPVYNGRSVLQGLSRHIFTNFNTDVYESWTNIALL